MSATQPPTRYQAFISYSRGADGELIAPALQRGLQAFAKPWYRLRALRVFRDDDNLSANPAIWPSVQEALDGSEHFILLASPEAARSEWVGKELEHWLASHDPAGLLLVQTDGAEIRWDAATGDFAASGNDAVPEALRGVFGDEPRYVDLRWARERDQLTLADSRFRDAVADIAAPLRGVAKDEIVGEHVRQHKRARRTAIVGVSGLAVLTAAAVAFGVLALVSRQQAVDREQETRSVLLANESATVFETNPPLALQFALDGYDVAATPAASSAVRQAATVPQPITELTNSVDRQEDAALSPDGELAASGGRDGVLRIWQVDGGRDQAPIEFPATPGAPLNGVAFSPAGGLVATAGGDGFVRIYAVEEGVDQEPVVLRGHEGSVNSVAFGPEVASVVSSGRDGTVRVWDLESPGASPVVRRGGPDSAFFDARISPDGGRLAAAAEDGTIRVWETSDPGAAPVVLGGDPGDSFVFGLDFDPTGTRLASGANGALRVWDLRQEDPEPMELTGHLASVNAVTFSPDGSRLATASQDRTARVWDLESEGEPNLLALRGHRGEVVAVDYSPDGERLLTSGSDGRVFLWDSDGYPDERVARWRDNSEIVTRIALDPAGMVVASSGFDGPIFVRSTDSGPGDAPLRLGTPALGVRALALDPAGTRLAGATDDGLFVWDLDTSEGATPTVFSGHDGTVDAVAFSRNGERLASAGSRGQVRVWANDPDARDDPVELEAGDTTLLAVAMSGDGRTVAAGGTDRIVRVWDLDDPETFGNPTLFAGAREDVFAVALNSDGSVLAAGGEEGVVDIWDVVPSGSLEPEVLVGHGGWVNTLAFTEDGERLFSVSNDGTARMWDVRAGVSARSVVIQPRPTATPIFSGGISDDGTTIAAGGEDVQVRECGACAAEIDRALELAEIPEIGALDDLDRIRAIAD